MLQMKKKYMLIAKCLDCNFTTSTSIEIEPAKLTSARLSFAEIVASLHTQHSHIDNFDVSANQI